MLIQGRHRRRSRLELGPEVCGGENLHEFPKAQEPLVEFGRILDRGAHEHALVV
jgi:hypothetical protein